jgi:fructoselysine-6-phosphate deglycase
MLNFDIERFLAIQSGAVGLAPRLDDVIGRLIGDGAPNLFFLGTGGAAILMQPAATLLQRHSRFPVHLEISAELVLAGNCHLGPKSIVVIPSLSGTTKESVAAMDYCRERGATVMTLIGHDNTPLAKADVSFINFAADDTSSESFYLQSLLIALSVMHHQGESPEYERIINELGTLPALLVDTKRAFEQRAEAQAESMRMEPYHIITAAGSAWPEAFYYGMCILEEMQWIRTRPVHASDFFHGTLELVEKDVSVMLMLGEDSVREVGTRVQDFLKNYTNKITIVDTAEFSLAGISQDVRALISPVVLAS